MPSRTRKLAPSGDLQQRRSGRLAQSSAGFTLLEAIVAIAIVGIALIPVITFISQMVNGLIRAGDANARNLAQESIMELLETMNPLEQPAGNDQIGDLLIHWESADIIKPSQATRVGAGLAGFNLGFYNVTVSVDRVSAGRWFTFDMRKVGYQRIGLTRPPGGLP